MVSPRAEAGDGVLGVTADARFYIDADSRKDRTREQLLTDAGLSATSFFLKGRSGPVPAEISAQLSSTAHSCAGAASFILRPLSPLAPGEYTLVLLLDAAKWPAIFSEDIRTWQGQRALFRRYRVQ